MLRVFLPNCMHTTQAEVHPITLFRPCSFPECDIHRGGPTHVHHLGAVTGVGELALSGVAVQRQARHQLLSMVKMVCSGKVLYILGKGLVRATGLLLIVPVALHSSLSSAGLAPAHQGHAPDMGACPCLQVQRLRLLGQRGAWLGCQWWGCSGCLPGLPGPW